MADKKDIMLDENIRKIKEIISGNKFSTLVENLAVSDSKVGEYRSKLTQKIAQIEKESANVSTEKSSAEAVASSESAKLKETKSEEVVTDKTSKKAKTEITENTAETETAEETKLSTKNTTKKQSEKVDVLETTEKTTNQTEKQVKDDKKEVDKKSSESLTQTENKVGVKEQSQEELSQKEETKKPTDVTESETTQQSKPMPSFIVRREYVPEKTARPQRPEKPYGDRNNFGGNRGERSDRPYAPRGERNGQFGDRNNFGGNRGERSDRPYAPRGERNGQFGDRNNFGDKGGFGNKKPLGNGGVIKKKPSTFVAPMVVPESNNRHFNANAKKKGNQEKSFEDKRVINKRSLIKNELSIDDFDEDKTGYRKVRPAKKSKVQAETTAIKIEKAVVSTDIIPLKVLSEKIGITAAEITKRLFKEGIMKTINDSVDFDTAAFIADDVGVELELKIDKTAEDVLSEGFDEAVDEEKDLVRRPPVVTVMGHVDHGKTSILDRIRKTNVTAGEAGGITQHIGAYQVTVGGNAITFLDTPGHAAFTAMRARGAQATDIAVLVVAADDGIMPQTVEAINHAKSADVPIIVAVNKMDKPEANIERVKTGLTENGLLPEEWGGDAIVCPVSAKTGEGFDELLNSINLVAEIKDLKANPNRKAKGVVIEAKLDANKGPIATVLIQNGTLRVSDSVIVGTATGKIRAMSDDKGRKVAQAGPSVPVSIMGLEDVPNAGDILFAGEQDKLIKLVAEERKNKERENLIKSQSKVTLDDVFTKMAEGEVKVLNIIVKADVQGSVEAVKQSLERLSNDEVKVNVIHSAVGAIKESDIMLAESSSAIIIGFNVRPDSNAKTIAEKSGVDIRLYRIIYEAIEEVEKALKGMLKPKISEVYLGKAEVREVFKISGVGQVAGCYVTEGKIARNGKLRIYRDDVMICEGNVLQLKRFKDDVKEVAQGYECGISIEKFNDIKVGDFIESYILEENKE